MATSGLDIFDIDLPFAPPSPATFAFDDSHFTPEIDNPPAIRQPLTPWPSNLPRELALEGSSTSEVLQRCGVSDEEYTYWATLPAFRKALSDAAKEVREQGMSFKILCQGIALDFLPVIDQKLHDNTVPFDKKMDAFKYISKLASLEPKDEKNSDAGKGTMVNIQINL